MAAITLKRMKDTLARLEAEQERLAEQAEAFRRVIAYYEQEGEDGEIPTTPARVMDDAMFAILVAEGQPLHRNEIYARLKDQRIQVGGQDPLGNVSAHLSLDKRFKSLGAGRWGLKEWEDAETQGQAEADLDRHLDNIRSLAEGR